MDKRFEEIISFLKKKCMYKYVLKDIRHIHIYDVDEYKDAQMFTSSFLCNIINLQKKLHFYFYIDFDLENESLRMIIYYLK